MSVAPFAGVVALDNFKSPTSGEDGIQGQVPKPLAGQANYVLTANGWAPSGGGGGTVTSVALTAPDFLTVSGSPVTSSGTIALSYSGTALPVANGGTGVTSSSGANSVVLRDANQNIAANSFDDNYLNTSASGTAITLTTSSTRRYTITGSGGQVFTLPDATTLANGSIFEFDNNQSSGAITVNNHSNTLVVSVPSGGIVRVDLLSNSIAAGSWDRHSLTPANVSWSTNTFDYAGSITSATWNGNVVAVNRGGTGASTASGARTNLGLGTIATQDSSAVAITGGTIDGTTIGGTTAAAGTFTTLIGGADVANYGQLTGGATTKAVEFKSLGSDTNVSWAIRSKGTGAIDLATGSSGVNISNGGTVTAITGTVGGAYTSIPSVAISAPTTAGGTTATATAAVQLASGSTIAAAGSGYAIGDTITLVGGTPVQTAVLTVATLSGSGVATYTITTAGNYTATPSNPISTTSSGSGTGFQLTGSWTVRAGSFSITAAGSGYVEQPTVTFSGGGGSGAAAYASVGSATVIKSLFGTSTSGLDLATPAGAQASIVDVGDGTRPLRINGGAAAGAQVAGISTSTGTLALSAGAGNAISFYTNGRLTTQQFNVSHTASAVNYVQVTGGATASFVGISAQGSDASVGMTISSKGTNSIRFNTSGTVQQFRINNITSAVNYLQATGNIAGSSPSFSVDGTDTDIDLTLTPKGAGNVRFGTYTVGVLTPTGYITIKDSGGTTRRLLVG